MNIAKNIVIIVEECTEEVLDAHEKELTMLRDHYHTNKDVFDRVGEREEMWTQFLAVEVCWCIVLCVCLHGCL